MAVAGIIAEYNPFHRGHAWQVEKVRERLGTDTAVVAVMSGNYVQRGDFAMFPKHARAEMALRGGVDLVLELPTKWATATAEIFARGGVSVLDSLGVVSHLAFGCECEELDRLRRVSRALEDPAYPELLRACLDGGGTFAAARQRAVSQLAGDAAAILEKPNNALAVEYLRAAADLGSAMEPLALPRIGADHDSEELAPYASASAIRAAVLSGEDWSASVKGSGACVMRREMEEGRAPVTAAQAERAILARLRTMDEDSFAPYDGGGEGLYHRFYAAVRSGQDLSEILETAKTKRYPLARLRRMLLHSYLGVPEATREELPPYIRVLGANTRGRALLRRMSESAALPIITKPADGRKLEERARCIFEQETRCTDLYTLAMPDIRSAMPDVEFKKPAVIIAD